MEEAFESYLWPRGAGIEFGSGEISSHKLRIDLLMRKVMSFGGERRQSPKIK
jgi:hypothetical protein